MLRLGDHRIVFQSNWRRASEVQAKSMRILKAVLFIAFASALALGQVQVSGALTAQTVNGICRVDTYSGSDLEAKFASAMADSDCVVLDGRGFNTTQIWSAN